MTELTFLEHKILQRKVELNDRKIKAIIDKLDSSNKKMFQIFQGIGKFTFNLSIERAPFTFEKDNNI